VPELIILDTHIWVNWIVLGDAALPRAVSSAISRSARVAVSAISCFEIALLVRRGRLDLPLPVSEWLNEALAGSSIECLAVNCDIARRAVELTEIHRDPADRIIIATALQHNAQLASSDSLFPSYPELTELLVR